MALTAETRAALLALPDGVLMELSLRFRGGGVETDWDNPEDFVAWLLDLAEIDHTASEFWQPILAHFRAALESTP